MTGLNRIFALAAVALAVACNDNELVPTDPGPEPASVAVGPGDLALATTTTEDGLSISTDKDDYQPGDVVHLTGSGWPANDVLDILLADEPATHEPHQWTVSTDESGAFHDSTYVVDAGDLDVTFTLSATSQATGRSLSVQFTDANISNNMAVSPGSVSVVRGNAASFTVTVSFGGNNTPCTAPLSITGLPLGTAATFTPSSVTGASDDTPKTSALTITTTASGASTTPSGTFTFTARAAASGSGCTGADRTATGVLVVTGPATNLAFGQQPTNRVSTQAFSPSVTVRVRDAANNLVGSSSAAITLAIADNPGGGTLSGTLTRNAVDGVATFPGVSIDKIGNGYTLTASSTGLENATSNSFNITLGPASALVFTSQPSGGEPNTAFAGQPVVAVQDAGANVITTGTGSSASVALAIVSGTGTPGAALTCTANPRTATAGVATFSGCRINLAGSGYQLRASATISGNLFTVDGDPFNIAVVNQPPVVDAGSYTAAEGTQQTLAPIVNDPDGDLLTYKWTVNPTGIDAGGACTFDDDTQKNAKITCSDDSQGATGGKFTLSLTVSDGTAPPVSDDGDLTVTNANPIANAGGPYSTSEGTPVQLTGTRSDVGGNDQLTQQWTFTPGAGVDAGASCTFTTTPPALNPSVSCTDDGTYQLTLAVQDDDAGSGADDAQLTVSNVAPVADAGGPYSGNEGAAIQLNGAVSDAGSNDTHVWSWQYVAGPGVDAGATCSFTSATAEDPKITCTDDGTVQLTLTVTDDDNDSDNDQATLTLANVAPVADAGGPYSGDEGTQITLAGSATDAGSNDVIGYQWTADVSGINGGTCSFDDDTNADAEISCTDNGTVQLTLTATDDDGDSDVAQATLTVANLNPVANAGGPYTGNEGSAVQLNGSVTDAGANDTHTWAWQYVAGTGFDVGGTCSFSSAIAEDPTITCTDDGTVQLTLTVTDDDGGTGTSTAGLTVANADPVIAGLTQPDGSPLPTTLIVAGTLSFRTSFSDPGANDTHGAEIDCGTGFAPLAGSVTSPFNAGCTFSTIGPKTIQVKVTDDDGGFDVATHELVVKYNFDGFYAPVDRPNTMNVSKAGQAIPLKWRLTDANGMAVTDLVTVSIRAKTLACNLGSTTDLLEEYAAGSSGLQNNGDGSYQFNWKTPTSYASSCKTVELVFGAGGLSYVEGPHAFFSFKK